jgi:8-oxo-(d)GTP phosphatase
VSESRLVLAAGGIVRRRTEDGHEWELALVHRPRYDDWSFPKGKLLRDEPAAEGALREVAEETGLHCRLGRELHSVRYVDHRGRPKHVRYWVMEPVRDDGFAVDDEVDELRWCTPANASALLSYERDRTMLAEIATVTVALVRHAHAGERADWHGPDGARPLSATGREQARALTATLESVAAARVLSSPATRCVETVEPLAARLGVGVEQVDALAEGAGSERALGLVIAACEPTVLCTHGDVIGELLAGLASAAVDLGPDPRCAKASTWLLGVRDGSVLTARYVPASR